jgi:hypothetical protein
LIPLPSNLTNNRQPCKTEIKKVLDPKSGKLKNQRFVKGTEIMIPRTKLIEYMYEREDNIKYDTQPEIVQKITYVPNIKEDPIPPSVIDELRNPKTAHRNRLQKIYQKVYLSIGEKNEICKKGP